MSGLDSLAKAGVAERPILKRPGKALGAEGMDAQD